MDFGIARGVVALPSSSDGDFNPAWSDLTQVGTVLGTPPYMAPEQHRGGAVGPATDQYACCSR